MIVSEKVPERECAGIHPDLARAERMADWTCRPPTEPWQVCHDQLLLVLRRYADNDETAHRVADEIALQAEAFASLFHGHTTFLMGAMREFKAEVVTHTIMGWTFQGMFQLLFPAMHWTLSELQNGSPITIATDEVYPILQAYFVAVGILRT